LSDGKVGIGTTSPGRLLELSADTNSTVNLFRLRNADSTYSQFVDFSLDTNKDLVIAGSSGNGGIHFNMGSRGYFFSNGNVGIGTTSPSSKLHVVGTSAVVMQLKASTSDVKVRLENSGSNACFFGSQNDNLFFQTNSSTRLFISSAGNLGLGTTSPTANLHIVDSSDPVLKIQNTSANPANGGTIHFIESGGTDGFKIHHDGNENRLEFQFESSGSETTFMTLKRDTGNVGINETNPTEKLHVDGNLKVTGSVKIGSGS
jgi:hypothetical protein